MPQTLSPPHPPSRLYLDEEPLNLATMASALPALNTSGHSYSHSRTTNNNHHSSSSTSLYGKKLHDQSTVLDQLHAEQKSTIEALTYQIEFYRQREERSKKEIETLRKYVNETTGDARNPETKNDAVSVTRLAMENRTLGDEVDALRSKQSAWSEEKRRFQRTQYELEQQLQDARASLTAFAQAIEQLELKMQRKDSEEQTRALEVDSETRHKSQEITQLRRENDALRQQLENLHTVSDDNQRLRREVQMLSQQTTSHKQEVEMAANKMQCELQELQQRLRESETASRQHETTITGLQGKLTTAASDVASLRLDVEKKNADIRELQQQLQRSTELLEMREKLLTSDESSRRERETQRHELRSQITSLEREKSSLQSELAAKDREIKSAHKDMETMKARLMTKDHGVLVSTLRSEIAGVKERLRAEFKHEKDALLSEKSSLSKEITQLSTRLSEKERFIHRLQEELLGKDSNEQHASREISSLQLTIRRLEADVASAQTKYQQLLDARSSLAEQLDYGFKELLEDENMAASLLRQVEQLQLELSENKQALASSEARRNAISSELQDVQRQHDTTVSGLRKKIEELFEELRRKEEGVFGAKQLEMKSYLLEQDKMNHESQMANLQAQLEKRIATEQQNADKLREVITMLKNEKAQQHATIIALQDDVAKRDTTVEDLKTRVLGKEMELEAASQELCRLQERIHRLERELEEAKTTISLNHEEKSKRERRLLRERRALEEQVTKLVNRIEDASNRNGELGDKIMSLMKQLKSYETEIVALETQLKGEKRKVSEMDRALLSVQRRAGRDTDSSEDMKRRLHELTSLKESYQSEVHQLQRSLERTQSEKDALHRQRDEAIKRVSMLMKCHEQMKATVESHTAELVEEIEATQAQLDDERKRATVFLANEKTLLRDINDKSATITRLQQTLAALQQQQQQQQQQRSGGGASVFHTEPRKSSSSSPRERRYNSSSSFPSAAFTVSPTSNGGGGGATTPKTSNSSAVSSSAQELDRLLGNLERISEFSSARSPSASFCR